MFFMQYLPPYFLFKYRTIIYLFFVNETFFLLYAIIYTNELRDRIFRFTLSKLTPKTAKAMDIISNYAQYLQATSVALLACM